MLVLEKRVLSVVIASLVSAHVSAESSMEETIVLAERISFANSLVDQSMKDQQSGITSVLAVIDNLPGVLINEGDVFGSDDWSTTVSMRGFQLSLDEQQIGMMVDGVPNGNSNYGGGSKANRFIDTENLDTVLVSQGTADISSKSREALGGTLNFITQSPVDEERSRMSVTLGDYSAKKIYFRYDTGLFLEGTTKAYFSYSDSDVNAWIDESGESNRNHIALKTESDLSWSDLTFYASYDDTHEDNYQRITADEFRINPEWDRLTADWSGIPYIDQVYRRGWSTLRENFLTYVKFDFSPSDDLSFQVTPYYHDNEGRGDWLPPYVVDVTDDGEAAHSELTSGTTVYGGDALGRITYVDIEGASLVPASDCSSITFPYGGASEAQDPACFPADAVPVASYRHTHYENERFGLTADAELNLPVAGFENTIRAGLWLETQTRYESRDWHKVIDSRSSYHFDHTPYWVQYDREYPQDTSMLYIEDVIQVSDFTLRAGLKQWFVDVEREDNLNGASASGSISSDSDLLFNVGALWSISENMEVFAGYAENYAAIKDVVLEAASDLDSLSIDAETAENVDFGLRYNSEMLSATATVYQVDFTNRITFLAPGSDGNAPDFLSELDGEYQNVGGIKSEGLELSATLIIDKNLSVYGSYTYNDSTYVGLGQLDGVDDQIAFEEENGIFRGNTVFGSAEDMFAISLDWADENKRIGITNKYVGERWLDAENANRIDDYSVSDVYFALVGEELGGEISAYEIKFLVNNVFDEDYIGGVAGGWGGWLGGARTAAINLRLDF